MPSVFTAYCVRLTTLPPSCAVVMKSGNFLEPSGPLQACNGTALPYVHMYTSATIFQHTIYHVMVDVL